MNPTTINVLFHGHITQWNCNSRRRNCGEVSFGTFHLELLDELKVLVDNYVGVDSWIPIHPLSVNGVVYTVLPKNVAPRQLYGLSPLLKEMSESVQTAVSSVTGVNPVAVSSGEVGEGGVVEDVAIPDSGDVVESEDTIVEEHTTSGPHPEPLTTPEELDLFMKLHAAMVFPNGDETNPMPIDFELLKQQFNHEVAMKWREDPDLKKKYKMKTVTLLKLACDRAAESAECDKLIGPKKELILKLMSDLKSDSGVIFPDVDVRVPEVVEVGGVMGVVGGGNAAVGEMEVGSSGVVVGAEEQQEEEDNTMDVEEDQEQEKRKRCVIEDWNWQPTELTGLRKLQQRLNILNTVLWCPKCYELCRVSSGSKGHKFVNGHTKKKTRGEQAYPNCDTKGEVTRADVRSAFFNLI